MSNSTAVQVVYHVHEEHFRKLSILEGQGFLVLDRSEAMFLKAIAPTVWPGLLMEIDGTFQNKDEPYVELVILKEFDIKMRIEEKLQRGYSGYYSDEVTIKQIAKDYESAKLVVKEKIISDGRFRFVGFIE